MRRFRATLLLQSVILAACMALLTGVLTLGVSIGWTIGVVVLFPVAWIVVIELMPILIEHSAVRRAEESGGRFSSLWFVDMGSERSHDHARLREDTKNNPTLW